MKSNGNAPLTTGPRHGRGAATVQLPKKELDRDPGPVITRGDVDKLVSSLEQGAVIFVGNGRFQGERIVPERIGVVAEGREVGSDAAGRRERGERAKQRARRHEAATVRWEASHRRSRQGQICAAREALVHDPEWVREGFHQRGPRGEEVAPPALLRSAGRAHFAKVLRHNVRPRGAATGFAVWPTGRGRSNRVFVAEKKG